MDITFSATNTYFTTAEQQTLREILQALRETYCSSIGAEFMHITEPAEKRWWQERLERIRSKPSSSAAEKRHVLDRLTAAEGLERYLHTKYVGQKRFSLEGGESFIARMINWSPGLKTAVSDLEVEYSQEPGKLYYFKYMLADHSGEYIPVATTRPETILGDTAVAVHPEDERYARFIGKIVVVPVLGREIPVIADDYVDRAFGTGALKITPGHDPNDYLIGERHKLPLISVLDPEARINENGGPYAGQDRFDARKKLWVDMTAAGLVIKEEPYQLNVPRSQRRWGN